MGTALVFCFCVVFVAVYVNYVARMSDTNARPYLRSNLARTVYDRMMRDEGLRNVDLSKLYEVDELALEDDVRQRFLQLSCDEGTQKFIDNCFEQSDWLITQIWHTVVKSFLGMFMTQTSVNGLLGRGRMYVWSEDQAKRLLLNPEGHHQQDASWVEQDVSAEIRGENKEIREDHSVTIPTEHVNTEGEEVTYSQRSDVHSVESGPEGEQNEEEIGVDRSFWLGDRLLDLGAGDGHVTQVLADGARHVDVTEASPVMRKRLRERGYRVLDTWAWMRETEGIQYNVITALNLLDRCDTPKTLLRDIHEKLADDGLLVVALVLPFSPYVEIGSADNLPSENLNITGSTTEEQVNSLATEVFPSLGFKLNKWSRLPYLCEGDLDQAFYWLPDVILVLNKDINFSDTAESGKYSLQEDVTNKTEL